MKIAVRVNNWIGDVIMNLPAIEVLRREYPEAEIVAIARPWVTEILQFRKDLVDRFIGYDDKGEMRGLKGMVAISKQLRRERFDLAVVFTKHLKGALMMALAGIPKRIGLKTPETRWFLNGGVSYAKLPKRNRHQSQNYLDTVCHGLNTESHAVRPRLEANLARRESAFSKHLSQTQGPYLMVHAGAAYGTAKRWQASGYAEVTARFLDRQGGTAVLLGVTSENEVNAEIETAVRDSRLVNLCGRTKLHESLDLISGADAFLSNDSGLMHAAAAFGVPQVAIFGPTDANATFPNSEKAQVVRHPVSCSPCFKRHCPIGHDCMKGVASNAVWQALLARLDR